MAWSLHWESTTAPAGTRSPNAGNHPFPVRRAWMPEPRSEAEPPAPDPVEVPTLDDDATDDDLETAAMTLRARRGLAVTRARGRARCHRHDEQGSPRIGLCRYGPGRVAVALEGTVDGSGLARLRGLVPAIERAGRTEIVIDLTGLNGCPPGLVRLLGRLRIRRLIDQGCVEIRNAPPGTENELLARARPTELVGGPAKPTSGCRPGQGPGRDAQPTPRLRRRR